MNHAWQKVPLVTLGKGINLPGMVLPRVARTHHRGVTVWSRNTLLTCSVDHRPAYQGDTSHSRHPFCFLRWIITIWTGLPFPLLGRGLWNLSGVTYTNGTLSSPPFPLGGRTKKYRSLVRPLRERGGGRGLRFRLVQLTIGDSYTELCTVKDKDKALKTGNEANEWLMPFWLLYLNHDHTLNK